nr:MAG TPA_asm: hypothetical protein [Caudoviricetes sp.]
MTSYRCFHLINFSLFLLYTVLSPFVNRVVALFYFFCYNIKEELIAWL